MGGRGRSSLPFLFDTQDGDQGILSHAGLLLHSWHCFSRLSLPVLKSLAGRFWTARPENRSSVRVWWSWIRPGRDFSRQLPARTASSVSTFHRPAITDYESAGSATQRASPNRLTSAQPYLRPRWCDWRLRRSHLIPWSS